MLDIYENAQILAVIKRILSLKQSHKSGMVYYVKNQNVQSGEIHHFHGIAVCKLS